ncbi:MAG: hypothetical protein KAK00_01040 [Nanoarchaeota archaeon]|nr:hypothetical protein [Nanoarchaeota archaeon]
MNAMILDEKDAGKVMKEIGVQKEGLAYMLPKSVFRLILLKDIRNAIANIIKQEMLALGGDAAVNKGCINCSIERSDVLIMGTLKQIKGLIKKMKIQVSESKEIAEEIEKLIKGI